MQYVAARSLQLFFGCLLRLAERLRVSFQDFFEEDSGKLSLHMDTPIAPLKCPLALFRVQAVAQALVQGPRDERLQGLPGAIDALCACELGDAFWLSDELAGKVLFLMHGLKAR